MSSKPLIVIAGETASGKTATAIATAQAVNGEIVSADSWAVYRGFNIGTAKPDANEQQAATFHLIDVADAHSGFSAVQFKELAVAAIQDIHDRGNIPIIAGGTGLYIDSVVYDFSFLPAGAEGERERFTVLTLDELLGLAHQRSIDLRGVDVRNKRRVIRAIETNGQRATHGSLHANTLYLGIRTDTDRLRQRVAYRTDIMLAAGLENEVRSLAQHYGWDSEPMKGIGYREWREYFDGSQDLATTRDRIIAATMQLAKRQRTWFKRNHDVHWVDDPNTIPDLAATFLSKTA